jgi:hypothetical protein
MKRIIWTVIGAVLFVALIWGGVFYWRHLGGAGPALTGPPQDITKLMEQAGETGPPASSAKNSTRFPSELPFPSLPLDLENGHSAFFAQAGSLWSR